MHITFVAKWQCAQPLSPIVMKLKILSLIALLAVMPASGQLLWKVSGNGTKGSSYIFATHHIAPVSVLDSINGLNDALNSVDAVYGEIDMAEITSPSAEQVILAFAKAPADSSLTKIMTKEQIDTVNSVLAKYTGGMARVQQMDILKPAMVSTQIAMLQSMVEFPEYNGKEQLDMAVQKRGKEAGKPIKAFETMDEQLAILMCDPIAAQLDDLMRTARTDAESAKLARRLAEAYRSGNLEEIEALMFLPEIGMTRDNAERLLYRRNDRWIDTLQKILPDKTVFVAVGAGHIIGERGLLNQLKRLGYTVEPAE